MEAESGGEEGGGGGGRWRGKVEGEGGWGWVGKVEWGKGRGGRKGGEGMGIGHADIQYKTYHESSMQTGKNG